MTASPPLVRTSNLDGHFWHLWDDIYLGHFLRAALDGQFLGPIKVHAVATVHAHDASLLENALCAARHQNEHVLLQWTVDCIIANRLHIFANALDDPVQAGRTFDLDNELLVPVLHALGHGLLDYSVEPLLPELFRVHGLEDPREGAVAFGVRFILSLKKIKILYLVK